MTKSRIMAVRKSVVAQSGIALRNHIAAHPEITCVAMINTKYDGWRLDGLLMRATPGNVAIFEAAKADPKQEIKTSQTTDFSASLRRVGHDQMVLDPETRCVVDRREVKHIILHTPGAHRGTKEPEIFPGPSISASGNLVGLFLKSANPDDYDVSYHYDSIERADVIPEERRRHIAKLVLQCHGHASILEQSAPAKQAFTAAKGELPDHLIHLARGGDITADEFVDQARYTLGLDCRI